MNKLPTILNYLRSRRLILPPDTTPRNFVSRLDTALRTTVRLSLEQERKDDGKTIAEFYADLFNLFAEAETVPSQEFSESVKDELSDAGWMLRWDGNRFVPKPITAQLSLVRLSQNGWEPYKKRSGGTGYRKRVGKRFQYRDTIPGSGKERVAKRTGDRAKRSEDLKAKVAQYVEQHELSDRDKGNAKRSLSALNRYYGEHAIGRMEEIQEELERLLAKPMAPVTKRKIAKKLASLSFMVDRMGESADTIPGGEEDNVPDEAFDALSLTADNVGSVWQKLRDDIVNYDTSLSPSMAGSLAAARIFNDVRKSARNYIEEIDKRVRDGDSITDDEDDKYVTAQTLYKELYNKVVSISGYRPMGDLDDHPLAQLPISEPLENKAEQKNKIRQELEQKAAATKKSIETGNQEKKKQREVKRKEYEKEEQERQRRQDASQKSFMWFKSQGLSRRPSDVPISEWDSAKRDAVQAALRDGKPVPPEVLADYPDLAEKYGTPSGPLQGWSVNATMSDRSTAEQRQQERERNQEVYKRLAAMPDEEARKVWSEHPQAKIFRYPADEVDKYRESGPQEGDRNAERLVFWGGRWRREKSEEKTDSPLTTDTTGDNINTGDETKPVSSGGGEMTSERKPLEGDSGTFLFQGNTMEHKEALKSLGAKWDRDNKAWVIPAKKKEAVEKARQLPGLTATRSGDIERDETLKRLREELVVMQERGKTEDANRIQTLIDRVNNSTNALAWEPDDGFNGVLAYDILSNGVSEDALKESIVINHFLNKVIGKDWRDLVKVTSW